MTSYKRKIAAVFAACICAASFCGCSEDDGSGRVFKYNISANPSSLDPQTASDYNSDMLISSIYMGLLKVNHDGSLRGGVAEDYIVSEDGLVYTFKIRQDIFWTDKGGEFEAQCTAHDFVFAFRRLFDPKTRASRASEYYCIKNAEHVHLGHIPNVNEIGVKALGDFELEITLGYPNPQFPTLLTQTPAMPCNEEYFTYAQGKYGLSAETTPSNGDFYIRTWDYDPYSKTDNNFIILRRNAKTSECERVYPSGLNFFIVEDAEGRFVSDFLGGTISCIAVTDEQAQSITGEYTVQSYSNISVGLAFNTDYGLFKNADFRRALASLISTEDMAQAMPHYQLSDGIVPMEVTLLDKCYREYAGESSKLPYDEAAALSYYELSEPTIDRELLVGARIIMPDDTTADAVSYIMQEWQRVFGFYCIVQQLPQEEYAKRLSEGDYEIAVVELTGGYNSPEAYLKPFTRNSSENVTGYTSVDFERLMTQAGRAVELSESADLYVQAENLLLSDAIFIPLCCKNEYFFIEEDAWDIHYNPFTKTVDFSEAKSE